MRITKSLAKFNRLSSLFRKRPERRERLPWIDILLAAGFVVIFAVAAGSVHEAVYGVSRTVDTPHGTLVIELLDCSTDGRFNDFAARIEALSDRELEIEVVNRDRLRLTQKMSSFIIARQKDKALAQELARRLGLNPEDVVVRPLEHEDAQFQASLVLGDDFDMTRMRNNPNEET